MSVRRGGRKSKAYRAPSTGYLASLAWRRRRRAFLDHELHTKGAVRCACCNEALNDRTADVHHLAYRGVQQREDGTWLSDERDEELMAMCRWCHERMHTLMDNDRGWSRMNRADATVAVVKVMRTNLIAHGLAFLAQGEHSA